MKDMIAVQLWFITSCTVTLFKQVIRLYVCISVRVCVYIYVYIDSHVRNTLSENMRLHLSGHLVAEVRAFEG